MEEEMSSLIKNKIQKLARLPGSRKEINNKWICAIEARQVWNS